MRRGRLQELADELFLVFPDDMPDNSEPSANDRQTRIHSSNCNSILVK